jgi:beta-glucosidase
MLDSENLIKKLSPEEKIQILSGYDAWYTHKIKRLNIPSLKMSDGPNGVRGDGKSGK